MIQNFILRNREFGRFGLAGTTACAVACALVACGGGGGSDPATPTPVTPTSLTLSGTAATGKAVVGAVAAICSSGTGTATSVSNGSYQITVSGGLLPCIVKITDATSGAVLHSVATGSGTTATANITPLTELVLAQAAGGKAATLFASFDAAAQAKVGAAALAAATTSVATALQSVVNLTGINPFSDTLVAANGGAVGNGLDQKLDVLAAGLAAAQLTVADLSAAIVANGPAAAAVVATQVKPAAATCAALRSGDYRVIDPNAGDVLFRSLKVTINAVALTIKQANTTFNMPVTPTAGRPCQFSADNYRDQFIVSPGGMIINRYLEDFGKYYSVALIIPEQTLPMADLAGTWNLVEYSRDSAHNPVNVNSYSQVVVDAAGKITSVADCKQLLPCVAQALPGNFTANTAGGYDVVDPVDGSVLRAFAYRAASGDVTMVGLFTNGFFVAAKQVSLPDPAVGTVNPFWNLSISGSNSQAIAVTEDTSTVLAANANTGGYTRSLKSDGRIDTFSSNAPRAGLRTRAANACTTSTGAAGTCSGIIVMPLPGLGMAVFGSAVSGSNFFGLSVNMPAGVVTNVAVPAAIGTLNVSGGDSFALRASFAISTAGQVNGGNYDFHTLSGTMTPCTYSLANASTCFGTNGSFNKTSQGGPMTVTGSATPISLSTGPDTWGYTLAGTLTGKLWSGTFTKVATASSAQVNSGTFSVNLDITQN